MIELNDKAPEFTLKNTKKEDVSLSDFSDRSVVIAFYPGAFTGVCDTEMCTFQDNLKSFNDLDATVLGISVDSPWANAGFSDKYNLEFGSNSIDSYVLSSFRLNNTVDFTRLSSSNCSSTASHG